jgi:hypothetical protein
MHAETALMVFSCSEFMLAPTAIHGFLTALQPQQRDAIKHMWISLAYLEWLRALLETDWSSLSAFVGLERVAVKLHDPASPTPCYWASKMARRKQRIRDVLKQSVGEGVEIVLE